MPRLLLINPASKRIGLGNTQTTAFPCLNLPALAALTPDHYEIRIIDELVEPFEFQDADIVGITAYSAAVNRGYEIAQIYRERGIPTVMGGVHVSMMPEEAIQYCDTIVIGEAEHVWADVLKDFEAGTLKEQYHGVWTDLKKLPLSRNDLLRNERYTWGSIQTSRGCPMNCSFCSVTVFNGGHFRRRRLEDVITELEQIPQKRVFIADDNLIGHTGKDKEWTKDFFSRIIEKRIKKTLLLNSSIQFGEDTELIRLAYRAGARIVFIGFESVNPDSLKKSYQKGVNLKKLQQGQYTKLISRIRSEGIAVIGAFVVGCDDEDISIFDTTIQFVESSHLDVLQLTKPTPLPGTRLWHELSDEKRIINQDFPKAWDEYRFTKLVYKPKKMSIEDVYEGFTYMRNLHYGFWRTAKRTLNTLFTTKNLMAAVIAYKFDSSYRKAFKTSEHYQIYSRRSGLKRKFGMRYAKEN